MTRLLVNAIEKIRRNESPVKMLKKAYKRKKFEKYAVVGQNLDIRSESDCSAERPGQIMIGNDCRIFGAVRTMGDGKITIGNNSAVYRRSIIGSVDSISIGERVLISNTVHIYDNNNHPISPSIRAEMCRGGFEGEPWSWVHADHAPIVIEDDVWIGERAMILKGVTIGRGSIVACGAVVTKNVPPYTIVAGNPARVVKEIPNETN